MHMGTEESSPGEAVADPLPSVNSSVAARPLERIYRALGRAPPEGLPEHAERMILPLGETEVRDSNVTIDLAQRARPERSRVQSTLVLVGKIHHAHKQQSQLATHSILESVRRSGREL